MPFDGRFFALAIEVLFPVAFAGFVLLRRSRPFPSWAKGLAVGAAVAGLAAAVLDFILPYYRELGLTTRDRVVLLRLSCALAGIVIGIVISIIVACMRTKPDERGEHSV
jgi:hypothetical protein